MRADACSGRMAPSQGVQRFDPPARHRFRPFAAAPELLHSVRKHQPLVPRPRPKQATQLRWRHQQPQQHRHVLERCAPAENPAACEMRLLKPTNSKASAAQHALRTSGQRCLFCDHLSGNLVATHCHASALLRTLQAACQFLLLICCLLHHGGHAAGCILHRMPCAHHLRHLHTDAAATSISTDATIDRCMQRRRRRASNAVQALRNIDWPEALLFDCDGVLVETERVGHRVAFNEAFRRKGARVARSRSEGVSLRNCC